MSFEYLDEESEKLLQELLAVTQFNDSYSGYAVENLIVLGYVDGIDCRNLSDKEPKYIVTGIKQKGKSYFELKAKYEKEKKKLSSRDWKIAIVSAVIGAIIGLIPTIIGWF